mgnify:CR=1 FL=1
MQVDNLSTLGSAYQSKVIVSLIIDKDFLETSNDILFPEYFESEANQWIVTKIKQYYEIYKLPPTAEVFKVELDKETNDLFKDEIIKKLKEASEFSDSSDLPYVKEEFLNFCINQHYKLSIYKSVDLLKNKEYDKIKKLFDDASKVGQNKNIGLKLLSEDVDNIFTKMKRNTIPTPWDLINDISEGGSAPGELFIVVGGPGGGKCVGPNTNIEIKYKEIGIEIDGKLRWFKPWDLVDIGNEKILAYKLLCQEEEKH